MSEEKRRRILIAEDDQDIVRVLKMYLENQGYEVLSAPDGKAALEVMKKGPVELGIFDIMMPEMDGYELIREVRKTSDMPIIVLSAKQEDADKIIGLDLGADDYLTKPFNPLEVVARVRAQLRRYKLNSSRSENSGQLVSGDIRVDTTSFSLYKNGRQVNVTPTELKILICLMQQPGHIFTKVQINKYINGTYIPEDDNALMVHVSNLREKIEDDPHHPSYLITVRGLGYKFRNDEKAEK